MYPSSSSSSSQGSMRPSGLIRYDSAPGSFLSNAVDSALDCPSGSQPHHQLLARSHCFPTVADTSINSESNNPKLRGGIGEGSGQTTAPYFLNESGGSSSFNLRPDGGGPSTAANSLIRHSSSPAGFLNHLAASVSTAPFCPTTANNGFPVVTRGMGSAFNSRGIGEGSSNERGIPTTRLNSQLSFTRQEALSLINEEGHENIETQSDRKSAQSYNCTSSFGAASGSNWEVNSNTNTIAFSSPNKRPKGFNNAHDARNIDSMETQLQFGLTTHDQGAQEMNRMDILHNIPPDSVPCKLRAKRGFATHPRSIAERERRTRISGKLKKLQELVPNMDKQTSYADMLDLAVQQIKGLQKQVEKLENEMEKCTCGCKPSTGTS